MPVDVQQTELQIKHRYPEGQRGIFANHCAVQFDGHEVHVSFFEIKPPMFESIESKTIDANCVARIVLTPNRVSELVAMLTAATTATKSKK